MKIDVEGLEAAVIAGGRSLITRDRPVLFVEIYGGANSNADPEGTVGAIRDMGYDALVYSSDSGLIPFTRHDDRRANYFFVPRSGAHRP